MKVFLDANVLVAVLNRQYPLYPNAARILSLSSNPKFQIYTSPICLAIAFYFAEKKCGTQRAKEKMDLISQNIQITNTDASTVKSTIKNPKINDFEDGLKYYSAINSGCETIVTEDISDFYFSEIPVYNCERFFEKLFENKS